MSYFKMEPHDLADKGFDIYNDRIRLTVDYDDVDHLTVEAEAVRILRALNAAWPWKQESDPDVEPQLSAAEIRMCERQLKENQDKCCHCGVGEPKFYISSIRLFALFGGAVDMNNPTLRPLCQACWNRTAKGAAKSD